MRAFTSTTHAANNTACDQNRLGSFRRGAGAWPGSRVGLVVAAAMAMRGKVPNRDPKYKGKSTRLAIKVQAQL
jgi:hypothetical protein